MDSHPILACAADIDTALKAVSSVDPVFMSVAEKRAALAVLDERVSQLEELRLRVVAAAGDVAEADGNRSVGSWLARRVRKDPGRMFGLERLAVALDTRYAVVAAGLAEGAVNLDQAFVVVRALEELGDGPGPDVLAAAEAKLVEMCADFAPKELRRLGRKILEVIAPDLHDDEERRRLEREERRARAATRLDITTRRDGTCEVRGRVPEAIGARLKTLLEGFTSPRRDHLPGQAVTDPATGQRLPADRVRGEAFCSLLERLDPTALPVHGGTTTTVTVTIDISALRTGLGVGTLEDGTAITAGQARRLACTAAIIPAVLGGASEVLDLGRTSRLFSPAQRRALAIRHPQCQGEGCTVPATWCEAHHWREPWAQHGPTDLDNGMLLCPWHHHRAHDDTYLTQHHPDGSVRFHKRR
jgi:hypothetical protein